MPLRRIGYGFMVSGTVAIVAMIVAGVSVGYSERGVLVMTAVLGFAASTIGGLLAILSRLGHLVKTTDSTHTLVNSQKAAMLARIAGLEQVVEDLKEEVINAKRAADVPPDQSPPAVRESSNG